MIESLGTKQRGIIHGYGRYAPEFSVIGEQDNQPVVRIVDKPLQTVGGTTKLRERIRVLVVDNNGDVYDADQLAEIAPPNLEGLSDEDKTFLNAYIV